MWRIAATAALALALTPAGAAAKDYASTARAIVPSGNYGSVPVPPQADDQALLYDALTPLFNHVTNADIKHDFKTERLGTAGQGPLTREAVPFKGVTVLRDRWHVPHIYGKTNDAVTFADAWCLAEDRELLLEQTRYVGLLAAIDAPGYSAIDLIKQLKNFTPTAQTEAAVAKQTKVLRRAGKKGRSVLHDIDVFVGGINAYYRAHNKPYKPWTRDDIYSLNAIKGQFLGQGGTGEVRSAELLAGLRARLGGRRGYSVWDDVRQANDPSTPVSIPGRFPYGNESHTRKGNVVIDNGSFTPGPGASPNADGSPVRASNILMMSGKRSVGGHPLFLGGPQIDYFYPGLTYEVDLHGPGWAARGVTSAPFPGYVLIGRREDFAWTLTSPGSDMIDSYAETLCGSDTRYLYKGKCRTMTVFDAGTLSTGRRVRFLETVHGPVVGYATVHGRRVALSRKRSSYGRDVLDQLVFRDLTRARISGPHAFFKAVGQTPQTFNAFYADSRHIAELTTGRLPLRPKGVDGGLPTDGRGKYEWRGVLPLKRHPHAIDPKSGAIINWNNTPARGFHAADDQFGHGALNRVQLLTRLVARKRRQSQASLVSAMNAAATQDDREVLLEPTLAAVLRKVPAPNARDGQMLQLLDAWRRHGSSRLDRDLDGKIDDPGAAILDAAWNGLADATMKPVLGPLADQLNDSGLFLRFEHPPKNMFDGWYQYMYKDYRRLLGKHDRGAFKNRYCGNGNVTACAQSLWAALDAAGNQLAATQGPNPAAWRASATAERIAFKPGVLSTTIRYTNRPSGIQQLVQFRGHRRR